MQALARCGDERSVIRNATPLLDKPLDSGFLPEVFPAQLMVNDTIKHLQRELLLFQVQCSWTATFSAHGASVFTFVCVGKPAMFMKGPSRLTSVYLLQDHWTLQSQRQVLHAATVMSHLQQRAEVLALTKGLSAFLPRGWMGAGRSIADFIPGQLLLWMLDAEVSLLDNACDSDGAWRVAFPVCCETYLYACASICISTALP